MLLTFNNDNNNNNNNAIIETADACSPEFTILRQRLNVDHLFPFRSPDWLFCEWAGINVNCFSCCLSAEAHILLETLQEFGRLRRQRL
jgi:hypothetical protein